MSLPNKKIIKFKYPLLDNLKSFLLKDNNERHAFLYCNIVQAKESTVFLVDKIILLNDEDIDHSGAHVRIDKQLVHNVFIDFVNSEYDGFISCHSHPFENGDVWFSGIDDTNDHKLFDYFYDEIIRYNPEASMLTMVFGQQTIAARGYNTAKKCFTEVEQIVYMDFPVKYFTPTNNKNYKKHFDKELYNRQILAFGEKGQELMSKLKVTLVGAGGTGSILSEALTRLGVKKLTIIDHDRLELSNLNRWQGGKKEDVGEYKVDVIKKNLKTISEDIKVTVYNKKIYSDEIINNVKDSDIIIGAIDCNKARYFINRLSVSYLIPYLDCASGIKTNKEAISALNIKNSVVIPSVTQCMDCEQLHYNLTELSYALLQGDTREEAKKRKYIDTDDIKAPSVYPINMLSVSMLLIEFMNVFVGYKDTLHQYTVMNYNELEKIGTTSMDYSQDLTAEYCSSCENHVNSTKIVWDKEPPSKQCLSCVDYIAIGDKSEMNNIYFR